MSDLEVRCHCGAVTLRLPRRPERVSNCNCSICRRYGALWAYYDEAEVEVRQSPGNATDEYRRTGGTIAFVRCRHCGCVTHWRPLGHRRTRRMGVNIRNADPEAIGPVTIRLVDGADTGEVVGEHGPV